LLIISAPIKQQKLQNKKPPSFIGRRLLSKRFSKSSSGHFHIKNNANNGDDNYIKKEALNAKLKSGN